MSILGFEPLLYICIKTYIKKSVQKACKGVAKSNLYKASQILIELGDAGVVVDCKSIIKNVLIVK